ncbi:hypothetical protein ACQKCU_02150 [Heyndrickxia sporothermodurans]
MENIIYYSKGIIASAVIALFVISANYVIGSIVSLFTNIKQRDFLSTGSIIIFVLVFLSSFVYTINHLKKS